MFDLSSPVSHMCFDAVDGLRVIVVLPSFSSEEATLGSLKEMIEPVREISPNAIESVSCSYPRRYVKFTSGGEIIFLSEQSRGSGRGLSGDRLYIRHGVSEETRRSMLPVVCARPGGMITYF